MKIKNILLAVIITVLFYSSIVVSKENLSYAPSKYDTEKESIINFESDIKVNTDSSMIVKEKITVNCLGIDIKKGITRDFPTTYYGDYGERYVTGFEVIKVLKDDKSEPYSVENIENGKRLYIGNPNVNLGKGEYTYTIEYKATRQISFFDDHDELYWDVTGNDSNFQILNATARITLPNGITKDSIRTEAYTGVKGSSEKHYQVSINEKNEIIFKTNTVLDSYEGMTIVVGWPKGFVENPTNLQNLLLLQKDNFLYIAVALIIIFLYIWIIFYYVYISIFKVKYPKKGNIIPLFEEPDELSPASIRYIKDKCFDKRSLTAAIINMAVKGYLSIEKNNTFDVFELNKNNTEVKLSPEELIISRELFGDGEKIRLSKYASNKVNNAIYKSERLFEGTLKGKYFADNSKYFNKGKISSIICGALAIATSIALSNIEETISLIWGFGFICVSLLFLKYIYKKSQKLANGNSIMKNVILILMVLFGLLILSIFGNILILVNSNIYIIPIFIIKSLIIVNLIFYFITNRYTQEGRKILDKIEGFKLFLRVSEKERLEYEYPLEKTPELFEKFLPYALSLNVENEWSEKFTDVISNISSDNKNYAPSWYHSDLSNNIIEFNSTFTDSFTRSILKIPQYRYSNAGFGRESYSKGFSSGFSSSSGGRSSSSSRGGSSGGGRGGGGVGGW